MELFTSSCARHGPRSQNGRLWCPSTSPTILEGERAHKYPYPTTHNGNSGYVTLHWFHARSLLGEDEETLIEELAHNRETAGGGFYWMAPIVYAELMNRHSPVVLSEWAPAAYVSGRYDPGHAGGGPGLPAPGGQDGRHRGRGPDTPVYCAGQRTAGRQHRPRRGITEDGEASPVSSASELRQGADRGG